MEPLTIGGIIGGVSALVGAASKAIGASKDRKLQKKKSKELKKQTMSDFLHGALERNAEHRKMSNESSSALSRGLSKNSRDTASTIRGALRI